MKRFMVVGASSGIGQALTRILLQHGHEVLALCRRDVAEEERLSYYRCDVENNLFPKVTEPLDGLAYLPGTITLKPFSQIHEEEFCKDWEKNVLGAFRTLQCYLRQLQKAPKASITFNSSVAATQGMPFHSSIASAKAALEGFAKSLAAELAPRIRVNVVAPTLTQTPLAKTLLQTEDKLHRAEKRHPLQRIASPEDIAQTLYYLLSDESQCMTGEVLHPDGGLSSIRLL